MSAARYICFCAVLLAPYGAPYAASLKVSPAQFIVHDVEPGKVYDLFAESGARLSVYNDDDVARTWMLTTDRPSDRGRWERGYGEIPDATWCWFDKPEVTVGPNSRGYGHLFLRIPDEEQYYNQHWVVTLGVRGKEGTSFIGLAIDVRMQIETKSATGATVRPYGNLGLEPSAVRFDPVIPGEAVEEQVLLYNNDAKPHSYEISALFDIDEVERKSYLSRNYSAIPDSNWLAAPEQIHIGAGGVASMNLRLTIPDDPAHFGKKWEHIVYIQPDEGRAEFVRVQVRMMQKQKKE